MADRDKYIYTAKLAEQAEKYDGEDKFGVSNYQGPTSECLVSGNTRC